MRLATRSVRNFLITQPENEPVGDVELAGYIDQIRDRVGCRKPEFSECRVSQCRPRGVCSHDRRWASSSGSQTRCGSKVSGILFLKMFSPAIVG